MIQIQLPPTQHMTSGIIFAAIGTLVAAAIFGSVALQSLAPVGDGIITPLEQKCTDIARQGHAIHTTYPDLTIDELPVDDVRKMLKLDDMWMNECVAKLPPNVIVDIADKVSRGPPTFGE